MASKYTLSIPLLSKRLVPPFLRSETVMGLVNMLGTGIESVYQLFTQFVADKQVEKYTTGQTYLLEIYLNYFFDRSLTRIYIRHVESVQEYDFFVSEGQNPDFDYLYSESHAPRAQDYLRFQGEGNRNLTVDFIVYVPGAILAVAEAQIRANINKYKLAGKIYQLVAI